MPIEMKEFTAHRIIPTILAFAVIGAGVVWAQDGTKRKPIPEIPETEGGPVPEIGKETAPEIGEPIEKFSVVPESQPEPDFRKPIQASPVNTPSPPKNTPRMKAFPIEKPSIEAVPVEATPEVRKTEVASPVTLEDTLFAPAKSGGSNQSTDLPEGGIDTPVDASTIHVASVAPKDDQLELMQLYEGLRQFDNGIAAAQLVLKRDPANKDALAGMARMLVETGRSQEAIEYSKKLLKVDHAPNSQAVYASALIADTQIEEALSLLQDLKSAHKEPAPFPYETLIGFAKLDLGMKSEARQIFESVANGEGHDAFEVDMASKQLLLMDLDHAIEWRNQEQARNVVAKLQEEYEGEPETKAAEAVELFLDGNPEEATQSLTALRSAYPRLRLYPFVLQLADFSYAAGDLAGAEAAYAEALADRRTRPRDREAAVRNRNHMRVSEGEQVTIDHGIVSGDEGSLSTSTVKVRKAIDEHWYFGAEVVRQDVNLDRASAVRGDEGRAEGLLVVERKLKKGRYAEAKLGGSSEGAMGAVTVGKRARVYADAWSVGGGVNERANDSAQLAAVDGRQHRVSASVQRELTPRTVLAAEVMARSVEIDGQELGSGAGANFEIAHRLNEEEKNSNYYLAWTSAYSKFNRSNSWRPRGAAFDAAVAADMATGQIAAGLVSPEYSRHGVEFRHNGQFKENLFTRSFAGLYYRTDESSVEVSAGVGADWFFKEDMRLFFDALYTSGGRAGNTGAGVVEAKVGVGKNF